MEPRALLLLLLLLLPARAGAQGSPRPDRLCGRHLLRALVRVCGGPRWSRDAGGSELHSGREPLPDLQPPPQALGWHRLRRRGAQTADSVKRCCLTSCTRQDLLNLCPR